MAMYMAKFAPTAGDTTYAVSALTLHSATGKLAKSVTRKIKPMQVGQRLDLALRSWMTATSASSQPYRGESGHAPVADALEDAALGGHQRMVALVHAPREPRQVCEATGLPERTSVSGT